MNPTAPVISLRQRIAGDLHHLWDNHGTWWFHGTFHLCDGTARRIRCNLKTADLATASRRRDNLIERYSQRRPLLLDSPAQSLMPS
jgi:hypothetical protein